MSPVVIAIFILCTLYTLTFSIILIGRWRQGNYYSRIESYYLNSKETNTQSEDEKGKYPFVSIIVPMRNEARNAKKCVESILAQNYKDFELIVVDDDSTDGTYEILENLRSESEKFVVIKGVAKPEGWIGKSWAVSQGVRAAKGELFLFVDADVTLKPLTLKLSQEYMIQKNLDMFSLFPFQEHDSFWERVIQPVVRMVLLLGNPMDRVNDPLDTQYYAASGQFILISRKVYNAVGGHEATRENFADDYELARLVKLKGYILGIDLAPGWMIQTRMYTCFSELWDGWTRIFSPGSKIDWPVFIFVVIFIPLLGIVPIIIVLSSIYMVLFSFTFIKLLMLIEGFWIFSLNVFIMRNVLRYYSTSKIYAFFFPLGSILVTAMYLNSAYRRVYGKGIDWRGRNYKEIV